MFKVEYQDESISIEMDSQMVNVDRGVKVVGAFIQDKGEFVTAPLVQVLREILLNAVEHGNESDATKNVYCQIKMISEDRFEINVRDEGAGIPESAFPPKGNLEELQERGRGLFLINQLSDEVEINREDQSITAYITLETPAEWKLDLRGNSAILKPKQDISAANLNELRKYLFEWLDSQRTFFTLDLEHVGALDSVSLSLLVSFSVHIKEREGAKKLILTNVSPHLKKLFEMTQLNKLYEIFSKV